MSSTILHKVATGTTAIIALYSLGLSVPVAADSPSKSGYLQDSRGNIVRNNYGECWRTGYWTPAMAIAECDPNLVKTAEAAPEPMPAPAPAPAPIIAGPEQPAFQKITLQAETLFDFDKAIVKPDNTKELDDVAAKMKQYPQVELILVTGYTDKIGSDSYNQRLSQERAAAVKNYLVKQGVEANRIETQGKGEADPVVTCNDVKGKANRHNKKLIACLQPNRRVIVEVKQQRSMEK